MQAQRDETDGQHHGHGFDQHADKFAHRARHRSRLVLHMRQRDAGRQLAAEGGSTLAQRLAQRDDVAALGHRHPQRDHRLALVTHFHRRRVDHTAPHLGNIRQLQCAAGASGLVGGADREALELVHRVEGTRHPHLQVLAAGVHHTGALHGVLRSQLGQHLVHVQAQLGQAFLRNLDEDFFGLGAKHLDLGNIGHLQQLRAHALRKHPQFFVAEPIGRQRKNGPVDIAEVIVEKRPDHALWQGGTQVADLLAHLVPAIGHILGRRAVLQLQHGEGFTRLGVAAHGVGLRHLLQRTLDFVGHLLGHLLCRGAGPVNLHHHGAEGERRVLVLPQLEVSRHTQHHQHHHQVAGQGRMLQRPAGDVETGCSGLGVVAHGADGLGRFSVTRRQQRPTVPPLQPMPQALAPLPQAPHPARHTNAPFAHRSAHAHRR